MDQLKLDIFSYNEKVDEQKDDKTYISLTDKEIKKSYNEIINNNQFSYIKIYQTKNDPPIGNATKDIIKRKKILKDSYQINGYKRLSYSEKKIGFSKIQLQQINELLQQEYNYKTIKIKHIILGKLLYSYDLNNRFGKLKNLTIYKYPTNSYTNRNLYEYINYEKLPRILKNLAEKLLNKDKYFSSFKIFFNKDKTYQDLEDIEDNDLLLAYNKIIIKLIDIKNNLIDKKWELYQEITNKFGVDFSLSINGLQNSKTANKGIKLATKYGRLYDLEKNIEENAFELDTKKKSINYVWSNWGSTNMQIIIASMFRFSNYKAQIQRKKFEKMYPHINNYVKDYINNTFHEDVNESYQKINGKFSLQIDHIIGKLNKNLLKSKNNSINNLRLISARLNVLNLKQPQVDFKKLIDKNFIKNNINDIINIFSAKSLEIIYN